MLVEMTLLPSIAQQSQQPFSTSAVGGRVAVFWAPGGLDPAARCGQHNSREWATPERLESYKGRGWTHILETLLEFVSVTFKYSTNYPARGFCIAVVMPNI